MTPIIMEQLEKKPAIKALSKWKNCVLQTLLVGSFLLVAVPVGCSLFSQVQVGHRAQLQICFILLNSSNYSDLGLHWQPTIVMNNEVLFCKDFVNQRYIFRVSLWMI